MRVLVINGAPRQNGYTRELVNLFCNGVVEAGGNLDIIDLKEVEIQHCLGCYGCWDPNGTGKCVLRDDMSSLVERYSSSDTVVFATPLYFYSFSARIKAFIERLLPLTKPELQVVSDDSLITHSLRNPEQNPKRAVLIAVAAHRSTRGMDGIVSTFNLVTMGLSIKPAGILLRPESFFLDFPASKPITVRKVRAAFENAGREIVSLGHIAPETEREAAALLTRDLKTFEQHFSTYWQIAKENTDSGFNRDDLRKTAGQDLRILMPELANHFDPASAGDLEAVFCFDLDGKQPGKWYLVVSNGKCYYTKAYNTPTVSVHTSSEILLDIILQRTDPRRAIASGNLKITGSKSLFARFGRLFPPPSR